MFDYPAICKEASNISNKTQKYYLVILGAFLCMLVASSFLFTYFDSIFLLKILNAIISLAIVVLSFVFQFHNFQGIWYNARAVAESIKTISWRYAVKAEPYNITDDNAKKLLLETIKHIIDMNHDFKKHMEANFSHHEIIPNNMITTRQLSLQERFNLYHTNRVTKQKIWYSQKSKSNKKQAKLLFWTLILLSSILLTLLFFNIDQTNNNFIFPISILLSSISALFTWIQTKKYKELEKSYALAAYEISFIEKNACDIDEKLFSDYVINAENAFSREHTQWIARKDA